MGTWSVKTLGKDTRDHVWLSVTLGRGADGARVAAAPQTPRPAGVASVTGREHAASLCGVKCNGKLRASGWYDWHAKAARWVRVGVGRAGNARSLRAGQQELLMACTLLGGRAGIGRGWLWDMFWRQRQMRGYTKCGTWKKKKSRKTPRVSGLIKQKTI